MREKVGLIALVILLIPYLYFLLCEIIRFIKGKYNDAIGSFYYKSIYSLAYWFIGIIPFIIVGINFDELPQDKVTWWGLLVIPVLFIIDLIVILLSRGKLKKLDEDSDEWFYLNKNVGGKNSALIVAVMLNIAYLLDYLLIYMTIFGVIYGK